jgi:hypothetical protein
MKKVAILLAMVFGASVSMLSYADSNQPNSDNSQQSQPQPGADKQGNNDKGNDNNSGSSTNSSSNDDDDTAS